MNNISKFNVVVYGDFEQITPVLSTASVRLFYLGLNRNFTYITKEFADKLLTTLPYTPVVGKFENGDYTNHETGDEQLQIYGVVPENPNVRWEKHLDDDGVEREYACCDVLIYTARFPESKGIVQGTAHSMELYDKSIKGKWAYQDGKKFYKFEDGCFIGLCALGKNTEPCFEGAAFYAYANELKNLVTELKEYNKNNGGNMKMDWKFRLSDSQKLEAIFSLINPNLAEGFLDCIVCEVYDDYALCYNYNEGKYFRAYYTKDDATDVVEITRQETAYVLDVTQKEYEILQRLQNLTSGNYELLEKEILAYREGQESTEEAQGEDETTEQTETEEVVEETEVEETETNEVEVEETETEVNEVEAETQEVEIVTEETEVETEENTDFSLEITTLRNQISELQSQISTYKVENENLKQFQNAVENDKKEAFLAKYAAKLPNEIVEEFRAKMAEYNVKEFKNQVSAKVLESNEDALFGKQDYLIGDYSYGDNTVPFTGADKLIANALNSINK